MQIELLTCDAVQLWIAFVEGVTIRERHPSHQRNVVHVRNQLRHDTRCSSDFGRLIPSKSPI